MLPYMVVRAVPYDGGKRGNHCLWAGWSGELGSLSKRMFLADIGVARVDDKGDRALQ
jgi:hypothetical protein